MARGEAHPCNVNTKALDQGVVVAHADARMDLSVLRLLENGTIRLISCGWLLTNPDAKLTGSIALSGVADIHEKIMKTQHVHS